MSSVLFEINNSIAVITLNRPEKFNAFNREMAISFQSCLYECEINHEVRCVLITGAGKAFSAGQDLSEITGPDAPQMSDVLNVYYNPVIRQIRMMNKPVIAAVNGIAAGAGANIALCCDIVIACESAAFMQAFSKIGLIPDSGGTYFLPRLAGFQRASALMMLAEKVSAAEAAQMGMIYKSFPDEIFLSSAFEMAEKLARMPTKALAYTKQALNQSIGNDLQTQLQTEDLLQQKAAATEDFNEGVQAFIEKRNPVFKGK